MSDGQTPENKAPSGAVPPPDLMGDLLKAAGPAAPTVGAIMARYGIRDDDPALLLATAVRDATAAGVVAERAAERIEDATRSIGDLIFDQTRLAGVDLQGGVKTAVNASMSAGAKMVAKIIGDAANEGAATLTQAAADLEQKGESAGEDFIRSWRLHATKALDSHARSSLRKSLALIAGLIFAALILGGGVVWGLMDMTGHILPWRDHIISIDGRPDCGYAQALRGRVCAVR